VTRRLYLLRHAKSSRDDPRLDDHERPLAPRGRRAALATARWIEESGVRPDLVLCSSAARARATLDRVLPALGDPRVLVERGLYHASANGLLGRVRALPDEAAAVMLVGHNPGLHELACLLAPPGPATFPTGALATLEAGVASWSALAGGSATLTALVRPRTLRSQ